MLRFVATLNDGHTYVLVPDEIRPPYNIAIGTTYIDGKHILIETPKKYEDYLYAEILSVNGRELEKYLGEVLYPLAWHESKTSRFFYGLLGYIIGCAEHGTNGMPLIHSLPGGGKYAVCTQKCLTDDMVDYNNVGIKPDIECHITLNDYKNNYDRVMAEGLSYIRNRCEN